MAGRLIICATPIGNLGDASPRLKEALASADVIFAEDTRRTATLLRHLGVGRPMRSYFVGNEERRSDELASRLASGETVALVTDAGTPGVADPGITAVRAAQSAAVEVTVIPGPSAVTAALAASGLPADRFVFEGFLPRKGSARRERLESLAGEERTIVLFAAPQRAAADLGDLADALGPDRPVVVARELTKLHEELWWTSLSEASNRYSAEKPRGEFTLVVAGSPPIEPDLESALTEVATARANGVPLSAAVREVAARLGVRRRALYALALVAEEQSVPEFGAAGTTDSAAPEGPDVVG